MTELNSAKEQILAASKANNEPQQLIDRRLNARELMEKLRLPRMQRFDFRTWPLIADQPLKWIKSDTNLVEKPTADDEVLKVTQFGQTLLHVNLPQKLQEQGVILTDIFTAARKYPELFNKYFMTAINPEENRLTAYHLAYLNAGLFLYIPKTLKLKNQLRSRLFRIALKTSP